MDGWISRNLGPLYAEAYGRALFLVLVMIRKGKAAHMSTLFIPHGRSHDRHALSITGVRAGNKYTALGDVQPCIYKYDLEVVTQHQFSR